MGSPRALVFRLNDNGLGPELLRQVFLERGWLEFDEDTQDSFDWNLWWRTSRFRMNEYSELMPWQRLNHIPKSFSITKKDCLARNLKRNKSNYKAYSFGPESFNLPNDYTRFVAEYTRLRQEGDAKSLWICKPADLSRGRGIFVFRDLSTLQYDCNAVVQRYIMNPLLISGYKFDLRIYVFVQSFHPLTVYIYREGIVRFSTEKFDIDCPSNVFAHLTNTSINKHSPNYAVEKERVGAGCKWTLTQLRLYFHQNNVDDRVLWQRIINIVTLTLAMQVQQVPHCDNCFELYGFDILIDDNLRPWLLEVNFSPALNSDCQVDVLVKKPMIHDLLDIINFKDSDMERGGENHRLRQISRAFGIHPTTRKPAHSSRQHARNGHPTSRRTPRQEGVIHYHSGAPSASGVEEEEGEEEEEEDDDLSSTNRSAASRRVGNVSGLGHRGESPAYSSSVREDGPEATEADRDSDRAASSHPTQADWDQDLRRLSLSGRRSEARRAASEKKAAPMREEREDEDSQASGSQGVEPDHRASSNTAGACQDPSLSTSEDRKRKDIPHIQSMGKSISDMSGNNKRTKSASSIAKPLSASLMSASHRTKFDLAFNRKAESNNHLDFFPPNNAGLTRRRPSGRHRLLPMKPVISPRRELQKGKPATKNSTRGVHSSTNNNAKVPHVSPDSGISTVSSSSDTSDAIAEDGRHLIPLASGDRRVSSLHSGAKQGPQSASQRQFKPSVSGPSTELGAAEQNSRHAKTSQMADLSKDPPPSLPSLSARPGSGRSQGGRTNRHPDALHRLHRKPPPGSLGQLPNRRSSASLQSLPGSELRGKSHVGGKLSTGSTPRAQPRQRPSYKTPWRTNTTLQETKTADHDPASGQHKAHSQPSSGGHAHTRRNHPKRVGDFFLVFPFNEATRRVAASNVGPNFLRAVVDETQKLLKDCISNSKPQQPEEDRDTEQIWGPFRPEESV